MTDLNLRLDRDVLTIAENARKSLIDSGLNVDLDANLTMAVEPEVIERAISEDIGTGAQCVVANVIDFAPSSLRRMGALQEAKDLAKASVAFVQNKQVQHPLIRVFPSKLPLDPSSKQSLNEHADEYKFVGNLFEGMNVDGFLLHGFENATELKCALIGLRKSTQKTIVYDKAMFENSGIEDADYEPASSKIAVVDYDDVDHIDQLLDASTALAESGIQFLLVKNANPSKTAAVCALTSGLQVRI